MRKVPSSPQDSPVSSYTSANGVIGEKQKKGCCKCSATCKVCIGIWIVVAIVVVICAAAIGGVFGVAYYFCEAAQYEKEDVFSYSIDDYTKLSLVMPNIRESIVAIKPLPTDSTYAKKNITIVAKARAASQSYLPSFSQDFSQTSPDNGHIVAHLKYTGSTSLLLGCPKYVVTIYLPVNRMLAAVDVYSTNAKYEVEGLMAVQLKLTAGIGSVSIKNSDISIIDAKTIQGAVTISDVYSDVHTGIQVTTQGSISLTKFSAPGDASLVTFGGDISIQECFMKNKTATMKAVTQLGNVNVGKWSSGSLDLTANVGTVTATISNAFKGQIDAEGTSVDTFSGFTGTVSYSTNTDKKKSATVGGETSSRIIAKCKTGSVKVYGTNLSN